jgi:hypothetical protein
MRSFLPKWLRGGADELGWDDLVREVGKAVGGLARHGARGKIAFPADVTVHIEVGHGGVDVIRQFVAKREFDVEVAAAVSNRYDCALSDLPEREYQVAPAEATRIRATEGARRVWELAVEGGDLSGQVLVLPSGRAELRFGRGPFHGADQALRNDVVVCEKSEFVSRRAGRIMVAGARLEIEAVDQADGLVVHRVGGETIRPARTAKGRVTAGADDVMELTDGRGGSIRLTIVRRPVAEEPARGSDHT